MITRKIAKTLALLTVLPHIAVAQLTSHGEPQDITADMIGKAGIYRDMPIVFSEETKMQGITLTLDSLEYRAKGGSVKTTIDATAEVQLPFATSATGQRTVKFEGKRINIYDNAPKRIYLKSQHEFTLIKDKVKMVILPTIAEGNASDKGDCSTADSSFVEFDCNGVQDVMLAGRFVFSESFLKPASGKGGPVVANFSFRYSSGLITKVCFSDSFRVGGCGDFVFEVTDAIADFSEATNGAGFSLPHGYWDGPLPEQAWMGFFLREVSARLPKELNINKNKASKPKIALKNVLIDDYGFTGQLLATEMIETESNGNAGLNLAIDTIGVEFWQNDLAGGLLSGRANVPFIKGEADKAETTENGYNLALRGEIGYEPSTDKFLFNARATTMTGNEYKVPFTNKAKIKINKGSYFEFGNSNGALDAALCLNGELSIDANISFKGIAFEQLRFATDKPHISVRSMAMQGECGANFGGFGLTLKRLGLTMPEDGESANLDIAANIELMAGSGTIGADAGFTVIAEHDPHWKFKSLKVNEIGLDLDFSAFHLKGLIRHFENDYTYGDGYHGELLLTLSEFGFGVDGKVRFGKVNGTKYWFTKAEADLSSAHIMLFPPGVFLKSLSGGCYHHMSKPAVAKEGQRTISLASPEAYKPDKNVGFGFMAGVGAFFMNKSLVSANVEFEMAFNNNFGINFVSLTGIASILKEMQIGDTVTKGVIGAWLSARYDRPNKTFHSDIGAYVDFHKILEGDAHMTIHTDPDQWYFWLGSVNDPCRLDFIDIITAKSYFMIGKIPSALPPLSPWLAAKMGMSNSNAEGQDNVIYNGNGFAFGVGVSAKANVSLPKKIFYAGFRGEAGTDLLVGSGQCGRTSWRANGRAYAYLDGYLGASLLLPDICKKKIMGVKIYYPCLRKKDVDIFTGEAWSILEGAIPAPAYFTGDLSFKCKILMIKMPTVKIGVSLGKDC